MKKRLSLSFALVALFFAAFYFLNEEKLSIPEKVDLSADPEMEEEEYNEERMKLKMADWTPEAAAHHQAILKKYAAHAVSKANYKTTGTSETYGGVKGEWVNRAPRNMPGAFKFVEMLDGTDTIFAVTLNHYSGEYNSKSYIYKGTIYNPTSGTKGDDFICLTANWPNKYRSLHAFKHNGITRLIAGIENGPVYFSDDEGKTWNLSSGLTSVIQSVIINKQDNNVIYATDGASVFASSDAGQNFTVLETFSGSANSFLYTPRYASQSGAANVYLARNGSFYQLNTAKTAFTLKGTYTGAHTWNSFSIGGDENKLYVTENSRYYVSTDQGVSWTTKTPKGNWYGDRTGAMSAGMFIGVSPANADHVAGGYAQPVFSTDGLNTDESTTSGWGNYQNGTNLSATQYYDRIRFNYHPDFQAMQFFYNGTGDLFLAGSTDGGVFVSCKAWFDHPTSTAYDNSGFSTAHFINTMTMGVPTALIYRNNLFTGKNSVNDIVYSTQDQGSQDVIPGSSGNSLDVYQTIGGDGPPLKSIDGNWVWKWQREGKEVWIPEELYDASNNLKRIGTVSNAISNNASVTFANSSTVGWTQTYIDRAAPGERIWLLGKNLNRATVNGASITGLTITKNATHQITALVQATVNPDKLAFLQAGKVYLSSNRGDSFGNEIATPFTATSNKQNIGSGWYLPNNDQWLLFAGPSTNGVGAILSKDGGVTWTDVTGDFPSGDDFQVGGMVGTPDGKYVFAGTDVGPFVFVVAEEKWYPMFGSKAGMFNTTSIEYLAAEKIVRFGTWGAGVYDFVIDDGSPSLTINTVADGNQTCDSLVVEWQTNVQGSGTLKLYKSAALIDSWTITDIQDNRKAVLIAESYLQGEDYKVELDANTISKKSNVFSIVGKMKTLASSHLSIKSVDSEHSVARAASNVIDGDQSTFWHTEWSPGNPPFPHTIVFESDTLAEWVSFTHLPRQDGSANGRIKDYKVYGSADNVSWTLLKSGSFSNSASQEVVNLDVAMSCNFIKLEALSEQSGQFYASMSEFTLSYKTPCVPLVTKVNDTKNSGVQIFPTLVSSSGVINVSGFSGVLYLYDLQGRLRKSARVSGGNAQIATNGLLTGVYVLRSEDGQVSQKITIK